MLVLARRLDEVIVIGENVRIKVLEVKGSQVRLGIIAPLSVRVLREELLDVFRGDDSGPDKQPAPLSPARE
jgi:carbon storage regulator